MSDQQARATKSGDTTEEPSKEAVCSICGADTHTSGWHNNPTGWHNTAGPEETDDGDGWHNKPE